MAALASLLRFSVATAGNVMTSIPVALPALPAVISTLRIGHAKPIKLGAGGRGYGALQRLSAVNRLDGGSDNDTTRPH